MSETWLWMTAADLGREIGSGAIDARELTEVYLAAIDSHPEAPGRPRSDSVISSVASV